jgi:hypothetical protein
LEARRFLIILTTYDARNGITNEFAGECSQNSALERLDLIADNKASEQRNTVQPQAVNLAYAEPCLDSGTAFFIAGSFAILGVRFWIFDWEIPLHRRLRMATVLRFACPNCRPGRKARPGFGESGVSISAQSKIDLGVSIARNPISAIQNRSSKMRTLFEDAHHSREVRILENLGDSFEDAHLFPRCSPKIGGTLPQGGPFCRRFLAAILDDWKAAGRFRSVETLGFAIR